MSTMQRAMNIFAARVRAVKLPTKSLVRIPMILFAAAFAVTAVAQSAPGIQVVSTGTFSPDGAQQFVLHSDRVGHDFLVIVTAPPTTSVLDGSLPSHQGTAGQTYPAIYALDAGRGIAGPLAQMMAQAQIMSPA